MEKQTEGDTEGEHMTRIRQGEDNGLLTQGHPHGECLLSKFTTAATQTEQAEEFKRVEVYKMPRAAECILWVNVKQKCYLLGMMELFFK